MTVPDLERALRARRDAGGGAFVPYVTGGYPGVDADLLRGLEGAGADAIEIGVPFSDPVMDGGVIQEASTVAVARGTRPMDVFATVAQARLGVPVAVMTYVNPIVRLGSARFLDELAASGVAGLIVPDLPVDEAEELSAGARARGIASVLFAAPGAGEARLRAIAAGASGFVYCVATYGVTGARVELAPTAKEIVASLRPLTELPLLVGVGISTPDQAAEACSFADGVIVGSALMSRLVQGDRDGAIELAAAFRVRTSP